jgi:hypothetical protein
MNLLYDTIYKKAKTIFGATHGEGTIANFPDWCVVWMDVAVKMRDDFAAEGLKLSACEANRIILEQVNVGSKFYENRQDVQTHMERIQAEAKDFEVGS